MPTKIADDMRRLNLVVPVILMKKIDDWRRRQGDVPNISEALRRLIELGIESPKHGGKQARAR